MKEYFDSKCTRIRIVSAGEWFIATYAYIFIDRTSPRGLYSAGDQMRNILGIRGTTKHFKKVNENERMV